MEPRLLQDCWTLNTSLQEDSKRSGVYRLIGEFGFVDRPTFNNRIYPRSIMERQFRRALENVKVGKGSIFGELDHPSNGDNTKLSRTSHIIEDLSIDGNIVNGALKILDTRSGLDLKAILDGGGKVGISSRGYGTTAKDNDGYDVVQEDYQWETYDVVANPAAGTYPDLMVEERTKLMNEEKIRSNFPDLILTIETNAREVERNLLTEEFEARQKLLIEEAVCTAANEYKKSFNDKILEAGKVLSLVKGISALMVENDVSITKDTEVILLRETVKALIEERDNGIDAAKRAIVIAQKASMSNKLYELTDGYQDATEVKSIINEEMNTFETEDQLVARIDEIKNNINEAREIEEGRNKKIVLLEKERTILESEKRALSISLAKAIDEINSLKAVTEEQKTKIESRKKDIDFDTAINSVPGAKEILEAAKNKDVGKISEVLDGKRSRLYNDVRRHRGASVVTDLVEDNNNNDEDAVLGVSIREMAKR